MAAAAAAGYLRPVYFPSPLFHLSYTHQLLPSLNPHNHLNPSLLSLSYKSRRPNFYPYHVLSFTRPQSHPILQEFSPETVQEDDVEASNTRVLAQNVPWTSTADDLRPLFQKYGTVVDIELSMYDKARNRGLAFVTMASHEEAQAALSNLESYEFEGRVLKLNWAKPKKKQGSPPVVKPVPIHNLFVANLPFQARAKDLKEFFNADNGNVVSAEIIFHDNPRQSAGYGFVSFNTKGEAEAALVAFQGREFMGRPIRLARSRRFLRQGTKENIQSGNTNTESNAAK